MNQVQGIFWSHTSSTWYLIYQQLPYLNGWFTKATAPLEISVTYLLRIWHFLFCPMYAREHRCWKFDTRWMVAHVCVCTLTFLQISYHYLMVTDAVRKKVFKTTSWIWNVCRLNVVSTGYDIFGRTYRSADTQQLVNLWFTYKFILLIQTSTKILTY